MKALLLYPEFSPFSYCNIKDVCKLTGAKYMESPLGLITLAALFPADWDMNLIDMNTSALDDSHIEWADLVFIGGMLPQQNKFLELIDRVHSLGKKVDEGKTSQIRLTGTGFFRVRFFLKNYPIIHILPIASLTQVSNPFIF